MKAFFKKLALSILKNILNTATTEAQSALSTAGQKSNNTPQIKPSEEIKTIETLLNDF